VRILFLSNAASIHTVRWVNTLSERGHEVHLVYKFDDEPKENKINESVYQHKLKYSGTKGYFLNAFQLKNLMKKINPDVVNAHYASGYGTLARIAKMKPLVLSVWGSDVYEFPYQSIFKMKLVVDNLKYADKIASTSPNMADQVKRLVKKTDIDITITPFGINLEQFRPLKTKMTSQITIGNIKSLKKIYGLDYLIKAMSILNSNLELSNNSELINQIKLHIYGDGPEKDNLNALVKELSLENTVIFKGSIPNKEVPKALESFDIFCASSTHESFGVSLIEAMSMKLPVIATNVPGFIEIVDDNITGILVENRNSIEIAKALEILITNKNLRLSMGEKGRIKVKNNFDWNKNVDSMLELYETLKGY